MTNDLDGSGGVHGMLCGESPVVGLFHMRQSTRQAAEEANEQVQTSATQRCCLELMDKAHARAEGSMEGAIW